MTFCKQISCSVALDSLVIPFHTCAVKFANGNTTEESRLTHMQLMDQEQDHCFTKCLWVESNQYNVTTNSIDVNKIIDQLKSKGFAVPTHLKELSEPTDGTCKAIFEKTRTFVQRELSSNYE